MSKVNIIGGVIILICISYAFAHGDEERPTKQIKSTLKDRTVQLKSFEINYIGLLKGKDKLDYEIQDSQIQNLFDNKYGKWILQFYNKSNYWKFVCENGQELEGIQTFLLNSILKKDSKIGDLKIQKNVLLEFTLKKPENQHYNFEHSKLKDSCYRVDIYPHGIFEYAFEIKFCVDKEKESVVDKYRILLEDKQLGKKIFE